jgi:hypothetical protein
MVSARHKWWIVQNALIWKSDKTCPAAFMPLTAKEKDSLAGEC